MKARTEPAVLDSLRNMPPKKYHSRGNTASKEDMDGLDKSEYKKRRERNNVAVRKSRDKSRKKAKEIVEKVNRLRSENQQLEGKVQTLSKELSVLKDLFLAHAGTVADGECSVAEQPPVSPEVVQSDHVYSVISKTSKQ